MGKKLQSLRGAGTVTVCDIAIPYRNAGLSSSFSLTICLSDNAPGRKASALALATHVGELDGVPALLLQLGQTWKSQALKERINRG